MPLSHQFRGSIIFGLVSKITVSLVQFVRKRDRKFRSEVKETYMNTRILTTAKKRGHEQVVRSSGREKTGLLVQFEISIRKRVSGSARNQHGGCYVISEGKIKLMGFLVVG
jgi:hypothetical protein